MSNLKLITFDLDNTLWPVDEVIRQAEKACSLWIAENHPDAAAALSAERVRAVASAFGATTYVNAPGGRALYEPAFFKEAGMTLEFLTPYEGPHVHMLHALAQCPVPDLVRDAAAWRTESA